MKRVPTSGGLEWDSDGSYFLDAIPRPGSTAPITVTAVDSEMATAAWQRWSHTLTPHANLKKFVGWYSQPLQDSPSPLMVRFLVRKDRQPLDALYDLWQRESGNLTPAIIGACAAAAKLITSQHSNPLGTEKSVALLPAFFAALVGGTDPAGLGDMPRLNRRDLARLIEFFIRHGAQDKNVLLPANPVDRSRFWLALPAAFWQEDTLRSLAHVSNFEDLYGFNELAVCQPIIDPQMTFRVGSATYQPPAIQQGSPWAEAMEWTRGKIPPEAGRFLSGFPATDESFLQLRQLPQADHRLAAAISRRLVRQAREEQHYIATGQFVLELPNNLPWREAGLVALAIHASPDGLWCAGLNAYRQRTASWFWSPDQNEFSHTVPASAIGVVDATCAAFWRDLLVQGEEVIVEASGTRQRQSATGRGLEPAGDRTLTLPRRSIRVVGQRRWADDEERQIIARRTHGVQGHVRELPENWQASEQAHELADEFGVVIPDGYTFVQPHERAGRGEAQHPAAPTAVRARGLQTITALLDTK